ncbi:hypothetical protein MKZ38_002968 [Zalerion maritima]|uniref:Thiamine-binding protein domain-containing protein n=1 Tax=Zalerion maritima TaxID=339359 RepID=A0AAD5RPF3_9PEZI|nr:hypothetical protein MKZ38_002968 [Zalerion maritima]
MVSTTAAAACRLRLPRLVSCPQRTQLITAPFFVCHNQRRLASKSPFSEFHRSIFGDSTIKTPPETSTDTSSSYFPAVRHIRIPRGGEQEEGNYETLQRKKKKSLQIHHDPITRWTRTSAQLVTKYKPFNLPGSPFIALIGRPTKMGDQAAAFTTAGAGALAFSAHDPSSIKTPLWCYADFCLVPVGIGVSVAAEVAEVQKLLKASGLDYTMHSAGTTVEGSWDDVMGIIGKAHALVHATGAQRIQTSMRVGTRTDKKQNPQDKIDRINQLLQKDKEGKTD